MMNPTLSAALASEHRAQLMKDASLYRQAKLHRQAKRAEYLSSLSVDPKPSPTEAVSHRKIRRMRRRLALTLICTIPTLVAAALVALPAEASAPSWTSVVTPNPSGSDSFLGSVSCANPSFCVAVGATVNG